MAVIYLAAAAVAGVLLMLVWLCIWDDYARRAEEVDSLSAPGGTRPAPDQGANGQGAPLTARSTAPVPDPTGVPGRPFRPAAPTLEVASRPRLATDRQQRGVRGESPRRLK